MSDSINTPQSARLKLREFLTTSRQNRLNGTVDEQITVVEDPYKNTSDMKHIFKTATLYGYEPSKEHFSPWDSNFPENPNRSVYLHDSLNPLLNRLKVMKHNDLIEIQALELLSLCHTNKHIINVESICESSDETVAQQYDSIFFNGIASYDSAIKSMKMTVSMAKLVAEGNVLNGFANVRPPGHHATSDVPNGYCLFNNVAIAAKYLLKEKLASKILIVDFDVHHGQGTQQAFYDTDEVLYFSIHRYENGEFWPNLRESNFDYIGTGKGRGYNINVPLNKTGLNDYDYLSIILNILMPVAYEFDPSIVLVSAGYDACMGCPEGKMEVTPAFYHHLITSLMGLAQGKILVVLEGGYFIPSLAVAGVQTVRALLGDPAPRLQYHKRIDSSVIDSINDAKAALMKHWKCFSIMEESTSINNIFHYDKCRYHMAVTKYLGTVDQPPFPTRDIYNKNTYDENKHYENALAKLVETYDLNPNKIGYAVNNYSFGHQPLVNCRAQEVEARVAAMKTKLIEYGLLDKMMIIEHNDDVLPDNWEQVNEVIFETHGKEYLHVIEKEVEQSDKSDWYLTNKSFIVCQRSCAILCTLLRRICDGSIRHGVGFVRPPGHHAKANEGSGFCLINNVVVVANYCLKYIKNIQRILILDFDVHHGDGTQELTYDKSNIMYISMHRFDSAKFYPKDNSGDFTMVGEGRAAGYNANIAFNSAKMGNADYLYTWIRVVLPLAYSFNPDLILVSAGFDAGVNDPLGGYNVSPEIFGHLIQLTKSIAPMMLILEGGYNLETTSLGMVNCVRSLLSQPLPMPKIDRIQDEATAAMKKTITALKPFWPILEVNKIIDPKIRPFNELDESCITFDEEK
ncbi:unnamed protein product [Ceutorhynchus assimilis]|uniref:Histone deacetylase domain-containing protein n=1 Tax=Ceutorhynchus assimilis TaxID=467358 RepID=A0A9N9MA62_9CUCU|nr:unnamed protein product [Ceutorhynchus assimilis]